MKNLKFILLALVHLVFLVNSAQAHYDPNIGRWLGRDPIMEEGGVNLYGFIENDGVNHIDALGQVKYEFKHVKKEGLSLNGVGSFGQPGPNTFSLFDAGSRSAVSYTRTIGRKGFLYSGTANCNSITGANCDSNSGGGIFVYAVPEQGDEGCKWEFSLTAKIVANSELMTTGQGGATVNAQTIDGDVPGGYSQFAHAESWSGSGPSAKIGQGSVKKCLSSGKVLIATVEPSLRVSVIDGVASGLIYISVDSEKKVGGCK